MTTSSRRSLIIALTAITALIHLILLNMGMLRQAGSIDLLFTLNGLGYFALLYAYLNDIPAGKKALVRYAFIAYTAVTILAWVIINGDFSEVLSLITKTDELLLIALLWMDR
jgi:hypothetical protein